MVVEYIRYQIDDARSGPFEDAYERAQASLTASPHCLSYELARCVEEPASYILRIEWDSVDGHLKGFRASPGFRAFFAAIGPFVNDIQEMRHYDLTHITG